MLKKKTTVNLNHKVCYCPGDFVTSNLDEDTVMMSISQGKYYGLDETGSRIWQLLQRPIAVTEIIEVLAREYTGPLELIQKDVLAFLEKLLQKRIITIDP